MINSRGFRNNNPLNIRLNTTKWIGKVEREKQTDTKFVVFQSMAYGYRAAWKIMESYRVRFASRGLRFCIQNIICTWAPPTDGNDTDAYIDKVQKLSGIYRMAELAPPERNKEKFIRILVAMTCVENGCTMVQVPEEAIEEGFELAFP